jgi:replicative DNA helicase Mcm
MAAKGSVPVKDKRDDWKSFLKRYHKKELADLQREFPHSRSLLIDYRKLEKFNTSFADDLLNNPGKVIEDVRETLISIGPFKESDANQLNIRFCNLPRKIAIRDIRADHINSFITVEGILRKITEVRPRIVHAVFQCAICGAQTSEPQKFGKFSEPDLCPKCEKKTRMELIPARSRFIDSQKLRIQESPEGLRGGEQPQSMDIDVVDDLTGHVAPGDRIVINGILRSVQREARGVKHTLFDIFLECNSIEIAEKEFEEVDIAEKDEEAILALSQDEHLDRKVIHSIAPTIYGNEDVKEAIALQLFGGIAKEMPDASHLRGDIHILLVGDPGIAKSQLLRYVVKISPRGIYTSGKSSTSAGLTATAVKDEFGDGRWTLEAGALVLADMGVAAVDELDKMAKEDRSALHEAMEQQCYDDQTEVLTEHGWKLFKEVQQGERVATLSEEGLLVYEVPTAFFESEYEGEFYYIKSRQVDLAVTPNHRLYVNLNKRANDWEGFRFIRADAVPAHRRMRFQKSAVWQGEHTEFHEIPAVIKFGNQNSAGAETDPIRVPMDLWLEFLGYFLSEGCVQYHYQTRVPYRVHISQKNPNNIEIIRQCLENLPFKFSYNGHSFTINSKQLATHLAPLGQCYEKFVPEYAKQLHSRQIRILLDAMVLGDGYVAKGGQMGYVTASPRLAQDVTELLLKVGWSGNTYCRVRKGDTISTPRGVNTKARHDVFWISFIRDGSTQPNINTNGHRHIQTKPYRGRVYCLDVPHHTLYVRRNGIPIWCGNSISVAKAGITATLRSRCALLGAANPKLGRFDQWSPIGDQINMPPSLLSRFDLIFVMTDQPDQQRDEAIAAHILKAHSVGELIVRQEKNPLPGVDEAYIERELTPVKPPIEPELLRKYIAYSKRNCYPVLSDEAKATLVDYYLRLRNLADPSKPVPVTARQLEALVRLAEASARMRLSGLIEKSDADRVVRIVDACLRQVAYDPKTGVFDIDKVVTGIPKQTRDLIRAIKEAVRTLAGEGGNRAPIQAVVDTVIGQGFERERIQKQIEELLRHGEAIEPRHGIIQLI